MTLNIALLLAQLGLLLGVALALGVLAERLGAPAIVGEILAGVLLGPSLLGTVAPDAFAALFPADPGVNAARGFVVQLGALIFLFLAGQEIELPSEARQLVRPILPATLGMALPFTLALTSVLIGVLPTPSASTAIVTGLGLGLVLAPSSLPVIARIMTDLGIVRTKAGATVQSVALVDDVLGVFALAGIGALLPTADQGLPVWLVLISVAALFVLALAALRPLVERAASRVEARGGSLVSLTGWGVAALLVAAAATETLGVAAVVGSLLTGLTLSRVRQEVFDPLRQVARYVFTPLLFASFALGQNISTSFDPMIV
ncbi:MAG: cation:proton antiporter, partial [Dehalococcoidia bacterium]|nr:cation:proton antiporter [Dehalococcoidia bacterium]